MINKLKNIFNLKYFGNFHKNFKLSTIFYYISVVLATGLLSYTSISTPFQQLLNNSKVFTLHLLFWWCLVVVIILYFALLIAKVLNLRKFLQFIVAYLLTLICQYFIFLGVNVNNPNIDPLKLIENGFFQFNIIIVFSLIFCCTFLFRKLTFLKSTLNRFEFPVNDSFIFIALLVYSALNNRLLLEYYNQIMNDKIDSINFIYNFFNVDTKLLPSLCLIIIYSVIALRASRDFLINRSSIWCSIVSSLVLASIFNYSIQFGIKGEGQLINKYIFEGAVPYQILILTLIFLFIYLLVNRFIPATFIIVLAFSLISIVNSIKVLMRDEPLLISDFVWITNLDSVAGFVDGKIISKISIYLFIFLLVTVVLYFKAFKGPIIKFWKRRLFLLVSLLSIFGSVLFVFSNSEKGRIADGIPIVSNLNNKDDIAWFGFTTNARYKSLMFVWTKQLTDHLMEKPEGYSRVRIEEFVKKYSDLASEINKTRTSNIENQTIIFVLSESFSNPANIPNVTISQNVIPNVDEVMSMTTSGTMKSDSYGGGTANMEFQLLSGLPFYNFSSSVSLAYIEVIPKLNYFPSISNYFSPEDRIVIHPSGANNYNRYNIYKELGFAKFIAQSGTAYPISNPVIVGSSISDSTTYSNILENIDQERSQFFSVITMQNHSPWIADEPAEIIAEGKGFTEEENEKLTSYSRQIYQTDLATQEFLNQLSVLEKEVTVVFYGDHLPGLYPQAAFVDRPETQFQTEYFIWSNKFNRKLEYPYINSSDFIAALFEHSNSKVSPYIALLTEVLNTASIDKVEKTDEGKKIADDLYLLQYDLTVGKGYIQDYLSFFEIN